jgi:proline dehydrogenase
MPGEQRADALEAAEGLRAHGIGVVFTLLGENVVSREGVDEVVEEYLGLLREAVEAGLDAQVSVKLTQLGLELGDDVALGSLDRLLAEAHSAGSFVWIDMEEFSYKDRTVELFRKLASGPYRGCLGLCLQAYLRSTPEDLKTLLPGRPVVRLVKGAYAEPAERAFPRKSDVDEAFFQLGATLLEAGGQGAFATHDDRLIRRLLTWTDGAGVETERYEVQMLYGIRSDLQRKLAARGVPVRILVSYGPAWFPWYMRRLAERPANLWFALKSVFRG